MALDASAHIAMPPLHCIMTLEVTQAQRSQWVKEPLLPSAGSKV